MIIDRLAAALRAVLPLVPFDGNHEDETTKGPQLKEARESLALYDRMQPTTRVRKVCCECGSEDVRFDAMAEWSYERQEWVLDDSSLDGAYCIDCATPIGDIEDKETEA